MPDLRRARTQRRWYALLLPLLALLLSCALAAMMAGVALDNGELSVSDWRRLALELTLLGLIGLLLVHLLITWWLSVLSAASGGALIRRSGAFFRARRALALKRLRSTGLTVIVMRLVLTLGLVLIYAGGRALRTPTFELEPLWEVAERAPLAIVVFLLALGQFVAVGPLLQARYGAAVGALAATFTRMSDERAALAISGWFVSFLADINLMALTLWGLSVLANLPRPQGPLLRAMLSSIPDRLLYDLDYVSRLGLQLLAAAGVLLLVALRQLLLPSLLLWLTRRRLVRREAT